MTFKATCSIQKGFGSLKHNDRTIKNINEENRSWKPELSSKNMVFKNDDIKKIYHDLFDDAVKKYNKKQIEKGHSERQITNYYDKINRSKQEKLFYEIVIGIGNLDSMEKGSKEEQSIQKAIRDYAIDFEKRNTNFKVFQMIEHNDEDMLCHIHIDFVPFCTNNKRGLETKNSMSGALKEMGFPRTRDGFAQWRKMEQEHLIKCMEKHGIEYVPGELTSQHMKIQDYKLKKREYALEAKKEIQEMKLTEPEVKVNPFTKKRSVTLSEAEYKQLEKKQILEVEQLKAEKETLELEKEDLSKNLETLTSKSYVKENLKLTKENYNLKKENRQLKDQVYLNEQLKLKINDKDEKIESLEIKIDNLTHENARLFKEYSEYSNRIEKILGKLWRAVQKAIELFPGIEQIINNRIPLKDRQSLDQLIMTEDQKIKRSRGISR